MTTTINADTTNGVKITSDTSGILGLQTNGNTAVTIDGSQNVGVGVTPSAWTNYKAIQLGGGSLSSYSDNNYIELSQNGYYASGVYKYVNTGYASKYQQNTGTHQWYVAASGTAGNTISFTQAMTLGADGNMILGGLSPTTSSGYTSLSINNATNSGYVVLQNNGTNKSDWYVSGGTVATLRGVSVPLSLESTGANHIKFETNGSERARIDSSGNLTLPGKLYAGQYNGDGTNDFVVMSNNASKPIVFYTGVGGVSAVERARIDSSGNLLVGTTSGSNHTIVKSVSAGSLVLQVDNAVAVAGSFWGCDSSAFSGTNSSMKVGKVNATSRSINAAGTVNASGADYAEYMTKSGNFTIAKGDVIGIDANGKLTNVFADAVSFMVKSTDPSYVGGDSWGNDEALGLSMPKNPSQRQATEEVEAETDEEFAVRQAQYEADKNAFDAALEAARQRVDRIAFAGQVPVNVIGATAGQYIIPVNDNGAIKGEAVNEADMTLAQYMKAVGKVIAIESDGRAKIIVKVA